MDEFSSSHQQTSRWFDPRKPFFGLTIVWFVLILIPSISLSCSILIICNQELVLDTSAAGFNYAIALFRVPLGILATLIPIIAVFAGNHRSEQTIHQFELLDNQNRFSNYYKHLDEFRKFCERTFENNLGHIGDTNKFHSHIFREAREGIFYPDLVFTEELGDFSKTIYDLWIKREETNETEILSELYNLQPDANELCKSYGVKNVLRFRLNKVANFSDDTHSFEGASSKAMLSSYRDLVTIIITACHFSDSIPDRDYRYEYYFKLTAM